MKRLQDSIIRASKMLRDDSPQKNNNNEAIEKRFGYDIIDDLNYNEAVLDTNKTFDFNK